MNTTFTSAQSAAPFLRELIGTDGIALFDGDGRLLTREPDDDAIWTPTWWTTPPVPAAIRSPGTRVSTSVRAATVIAQSLLTDAGDLLRVLAVATTSDPGPGCSARSERSRIKPSARRVVRGGGGSTPAVRCGACTAG